MTKEAKVKKDSKPGKIWAGLCGFFKLAGIILKGFGIGIAKTYKGAKIGKKGMNSFSKKHPIASTRLGFLAGLGACLAVTSVTENYSGYFNNTEISAKDVFDRDADGNVLNPVGHIKELFFVDDANIDKYVERLNTSSQEVKRDISGDIKANMADIVKVRYKLNLLEGICIPLSEEDTQALEDFSNMSKKISEGKTPKYDENIYTNVGNIFGKIDAFIEKSPEVAVKRIHDKFDYCEFLFIFDESNAEISAQEKKVWCEYMKGLTVDTLKGMNEEDKNTIIKFGKLCEDREFPQFSVEELNPVREIIDKHRQTQEQKTDAKKISFNPVLWRISNQVNG